MVARATLLLLGSIAAACGASPSRQNREASSPSRALHLVPGGGVVLVIDDVGPGETVLPPTVGPSSITFDGSIDHVEHGPDGVTLRASQSGRLEALLRQLPWKIEYHVVLGDTSHVSTWLALSNQTGATVDVETALVPSSSLRFDITPLVKSEHRRVQGAERTLDGAKLIWMIDDLHRGSAHHGAVPALARAHGAGSPKARRARYALWVPASLRGEWAEAGTAHVRVWQKKDGRTVRVGDRVMRPKQALRGRVPLLSGGPIAATRRVEEFTVDRARRRMVEEVRLEIENTEDEPHRVFVFERMLRGPSWTIAFSAGAPWVRESLREIRFDVALPPGGRREVVYRVVYTW